MDPSLIRIIGTTGKEGNGENQFAQPRGICIDSVTKEIFVVDCNNHRVQVYHLNSLAYIRQIGKGVQGDTPGSLNYAVGICMDDSNHIYVADTNNHRVVVFNRITGGHVRNISSQGTAPGLLFSPYGVCVDTYEGILYVADYDNHRVQAFSMTTGEFIRVIGLGYGSGDGQLNQPIVICIDHEFDHLLVADYSNNRIVVFDKESGTFLRNVGTGAGSNNLSGPRGLCISKEANILFVADRENHRIQLYDKATYAYLRSVGNGMGVSPGQFQRPMEICVNIEEGVLLVVDGYNHRVQILEISELQVEKRRLKAVAQAKAEAELKGNSIAKPSLLAVTTQFTGNERVYVDPSTQAVRISFDGLGPLYDMFLPRHDVPLLLAHVDAIDTREGVYSYRNSEEKQSGESTPLLEELGATSAADGLLLCQADLFLSVLESLCPENDTAIEHRPSSRAGSEETPAYLMVAPALFALHSLLERGWKPSHISARVISLLAGFLANISSGIVAESERAKVLEAIVSLLRAAVPASPTAQGTVLETVLVGLSVPVRYQFDSHAPGSGVQSLPGTETNHVSILMAYFELLGHIFVQNNKLHKSPSTVEMYPSPIKHHSSARGAMSPVGNQTAFRSALGAPSPSASSLAERRRQSNQQRTEILQFVFGTSFVRTLGYLQPSKSKSSSSDTSSVARPLTVPPPMIALGPTDQLGNLQAAEDLIANNNTNGPETHPAFSADPRVRSPTRSSNSSASSSTSSTASKPPAEITVPDDLCSLVGTVFALQQRRSSQKSVSLNEFCKQQRGKGVSNVSRTNEMEVLHQRDSTVSALQLKLFQIAAAYLQSLRSDEDVHSVSSDSRTTSVAHRSRGGRNIWRQNEPLAAGDLVDAQDKEKCWFESIVQEIHADGGVKVHFMGWGSKWDDTISPAELSARLVPLNTKTKNWRADLFKGGLIEIKCNDDPINQKWMWGKISALNVEEAWVEVSYLFSNEPTVVKRAWLFGETICPVGMHTKDKSKAAAALLVRPLKKVEDIIKEKTAGEGQISDEFMFFDRADDFEEPHLDLSTEGVEGVERSDYADRRREFTSPSGIASGPSSAPTTGGVVSTGGAEEGRAHGGSGASTPFVHLRTPSVSAGTNINYLIKSAPSDALQHVTVVGLSIMECLMRELLSVTLESEALHSSNGMIEVDTVSSVHNVIAAAAQQFLLDTALNLIALIAATPFRRLLVPYFTRVATFHSGLRARLVSGGLLTSKITSALHSGLRDFDPILQVLDHFKDLSSKYCSVLEQALGASISSAALHEVTSRVVATVDRCGVTQIANDLIDFILKQENLRYELFAHFVGAERFGERSSKLRKILSYLFKTASRVESAKFQALFEGTLMKRELCLLNFTPQYNKHSHTVCTRWATSLIGALCSVYESAQAVSRLELLHISQCHLAAERALLREFSAMPVEHIAGVALALAAALNCLLDPNYEREELPSLKIAALKSVLALQKIIMSEELLHHFGPAYEAHLTRRLLSGAYSSIATEKSVLEGLPLLPRAAKMLGDISHASATSPDFARYLMAGIDSDEIEYAPVLGLVLQKRQVAIQVLCHSTWGRHAHSDMFANLRLPAPMQTIQTHFNVYYKTTARQTKGSCSRRLIWCHGAGQVVLTFHQRDGGKVDLRVNEAQATVLWAFNLGHKNKTVQEICKVSNLSLEEVRGVLSCLSSHSLRLPLLKPHQSGDIEFSSTFSLSDALVSGDFEESVYGGGVHAEQEVEYDYGTLAACHGSAVDVAVMKDWRGEIVDASVVRVLKISARHANNRSGVMSSAELVESVLKELFARGQRTNSVVKESDILRRADHLASLGYIDKLNLSSPRGGIVDAVDGADVLVSDLGVSVGYSYLPGEPEKPQTSSEGTHVSGGELFLSLVELVDAAVVTTPAPERMQPTDQQSDSGEGEGKGDCDESKLADSQVPDAVTEDVDVSLENQLPTERVLTSEQLLRGIVHWTSSVRPVRSAPAVSAHSGSGANQTVTTATSASKATTPPRSERRLSNRFGSSASSPLRFSDSPKVGMGGSESKSGAEAKSPFQHKLSGRNSPAGSKLPAHSPPRGPALRPTPPPLMGSSLLFAGFADVPSPGLKSFATFATAQLKVMTERVYATLGDSVSQLNVLLYQYHLSRLDPAVKTNIEHFPPPSIKSYLACLTRAHAVDVRDLNDWPELHRELFFTLPTDLILTICRKFSALLRDPTESLLDAEAAKELWTKRFPLLATQAGNTPSGETDAEDCKQSASALPPRDVLTSPKATLKLSLNEYVFSTFACSHPRSLDSLSADQHEKFDFKGSGADFHGMFPAGAHSTPMRDNFTDISSTPGSSGSKSDKRRARYRFARPASASPNQSRSTRGSATEDPTLQSGLTSLGVLSSLLSDQTTNPFGISFGYGGAVSPEFNSMLNQLEYTGSDEMPQLILAPDIQSENLSDDSSRSSSRSNSNGDFTVAQLMHSIESELRGGTPQPTSQSPFTAPVVPFGEELFAADKKEESAPRKPASRSLLAPLPAGFLFKPEHSMFMPPGYYTNDSTESLPVSGSKSYNISIPAARVSTKDSPQTVETITQSLQDLLRVYHRAFQKHLHVTFREAWTDHPPVAEVPLSQCATIKIVQLLIQVAAQRVSELSLRDEPNNRVLWFAHGDLSLNEIFQAAVVALDGSNGSLKLDSFQNEHVITDVVLTDADIEENVFSSSNNEADSLKGEQRVRYQSFYHFVRHVSVALDLSVSTVLQQLARRNWDAGRLADELFTDSQADASEKMTRDLSRRSFLRLSESFADMFARDIHPTDCSPTTALCEKCTEQSVCTEIFSLRCRHFACKACWATHIEQAVSQGACHIACLCCTEQDGQCGERAGLNLVTAVCGTSVATVFATNRMSIYSTDYALCNELKLSENDNQLETIVRQPQSECISPSKPSMQTPLRAEKASNRPAPTVVSSPLAHYSLPVHSILQVGSPIRALPPSRVRSPATANVRTGGGTPNRPLSSPRGDRESILPRVFAGLSSFSIPRISTSSPGIGIDASSGAWASDKTEGHTSKYLLETKMFMRTRAVELETQLKHNESEVKFEFISHQLQVLTQYLRAVSLVEFVETLHIPVERGTTKTWLHCIHEALESLRDLLIVTNIKVRSKWMTAEGLTEAVTREVVSCLRVRMRRLVTHLQSQAVYKQKILCDSTKDIVHRNSPQSLVSSKMSVSPVCDLLTAHSESWVEFGNKAGCTLLIEGISSSQNPPEKSANLDKFSDCQQLIEVLGGHQSMSQSVLLSQLKAVEGLLVAGFQTVLFANNICPVLMSVCKHHSESLSVCLVALTLMEKLSHQNAPCAATLVQLGVWDCWTALLSQRRADPEVCITCCTLMLNLFSTSEEHRRAALEAFDAVRGFDVLIAVLHTHHLDVPVCRAVHLAVLQAVDKTYNTESTFVRSGMCEVLISNLFQFAAYPGVKLQYATLLERLAAGNKFMQERLLGLEVFENLIEIINDHAAFDAALLKQTCVAVNALSSTYHAGQTKFATMGGCKAICHALRVCQDLSALTSVLRTVATLALRNSYVQDFFQLESVVDLLLSKRDEISALSTRSESFETKSKANLLLLSLEFALDTVRIPASHHSANHDLTAIAAIAGMRRAGGRLNATAAMSTTAPRIRPSRRADFSDHELEEARGDL